MPFDAIVVALISPPAGFVDRLKLPGLPATHADGFETHVLPDDAQLETTLVAVRPQVIVSFGAAESFRRLWTAPLEIRQRWLNFETSADPASVARAILDCFVTNATSTRFAEQPLISVFTPTYKTGDKIERPFRSLLAQSYSNWEWVVLDDSPDDGATFAELCALGQRDHRISVHRPDRPCGIIGRVKRRACGLCRGQILLELDHDDELAPDALEHLVAAAAKHPEAGFFYSDCAEIFLDGTPATYAEGWGMGFGSYRSELHQGRALKVTNYPPINPRTLRHIVGVPNHYRAWRTDTYWRIGGHSPDIHVCDDYEIILRTFLATRMCHVRKLGYIQWHNTMPNQPNASNTQRTRNKEIQRLSDAFMIRYNRQIHDRLLELGVPDWLWREDVHGRAWLEWNAADPRPAPFANLVYPA